MLRNMIVVDAIDGAGKSTVIEAIVDQFRQKNKKIFDVIAFSKEHHRLPSPEEWQGADLLVSAEPTYSWVGAAIREAIIKHRDNVSYPAKITAESYALDRVILFSEVYFPFFAANPNGWIVQDRATLTSLAYQPLQAQRNGEELSLETVAAMRGNTIELENAPKLVLLLDVAPAVAQARMQGRTEKQDNSVFDHLSFQEQIAERYHDEDVLRPYRTAGSKIEYVDGSQTKELVAQQTRALTNELFA